MPLTRLYDLFFILDNLLHGQDKDTDSFTFRQYNYIDSALIDGFHGDVIKL